MSRVLELSVASPGRADRDELAALIAGAPLGELSRRATYHGVVGSVARALRDVPDVDPVTVASLEHLYRAAVAVEMKAMADLASLSDVLEGAGVPWMLFKGPVLSVCYYPEPGMRRYADLDVLVPREAFVEAVTALEAAGCELLDRNWQLLATDGRAQVHPMLPMGTEVDLHWHVINRAEVRQSFEVDVSGLLDRSRTVQLDGLAVRTFGTEDTLLHLCLHAGLAGGDRLVWLKDIERVVAAGAIDWDEVAERAGAWGASTIVGVILGRTRRVIGAPVPHWVEERLAGRSALATGALVDRLWPPARSLGQRSPAWIWTRSLRGSGRSSVRAILGKLRRGEGLRTAATTWVRRRRQDRAIEPAPSSAFHDPEEAGDRGEYLTRVRGDRG